ncbi:MAG: hypothetical protein ACREFR_09890 [Limisphaerales bacterium]
MSRSKPDKDIKAIVDKYPAPELKMRQVKQHKITRNGTPALWVTPTKYGFSVGGGKEVQAFMDRFRGRFKRVEGKNGRVHWEIKNKRDLDNIIRHFAGQEQVTKGIESRPHKTLTFIRVTDPHKNYQLDYEVRTKKKVFRARKIEAMLLEDYQNFLMGQKRSYQEVRYFGGMWCDAYETGRKSLIEAKSSTDRGCIRMAVGQILDYAFQGRKEFPKQNMAILLPRKPADSNVEKWLHSLKIYLIWRGKKGFQDNANGRFTSRRTTRIQSD